MPLGRKISLKKNKAPAATPATPTSPILAPVQEIVAAASSEAAEVVGDVPPVVAAPEPSKPDTEAVDTPLPASTPASPSQGHTKKKLALFKKKTSTPPIASSDPVEPASDEHAEVEPAAKAAEDEAATADKTPLTDGTANTLSDPGVKAESDAAAEPAAVHFETDAKDDESTAVPDAAPAKVRRSISLFGKKKAKAAAEAAAATAEAAKKAEEDAATEAEPAPGPAEESATAEVAPATTEEGKPAGLLSTTGLYNVLSYVGLASSSPNATQIALNQETAAAAHLAEVSKGAAQLEAAAQAAAADELAAAQKNAAQAVADAELAAAAKETVADAAALEKEAELKKEARREAEAAKLKTLEQTTKRVEELTKRHEKEEKEVVEKFDKEVVAVTAVLAKKKADA